LRFESIRDFGWTEVPLAAWELVPFSFVVDWIVNVGDWLEAVQPKVGVRTLAEGITVKSERTLFRNVTGWEISTTVAFPRYSRTGQVGLLDSVDEVETIRTPTLDPFLRTPKFNVKLNKKRALDSIALLVQLSKGLDSLRV
jgi:hypothetical protein